jgi:dipeptidyl aminopeptidase/acylaminoacyl peptidase
VNFDDFLALSRVSGLTVSADGYFLKEQGLPGEYADRYAERSPKRFAEAIKTPILVIHGGQDHRVPVSQGLYLWTDLQRAGVESAYLSFPDEGHHILKPANARLWYETVWAWLDHHVHQQPWIKPHLL